MEKCRESAGGATFTGRIYSCILYSSAQSAALAHAHSHALTLARTLAGTLACVAPWIHGNTPAPQPSSPPMQTAMETAASLLALEGRRATGSQLELAVSVLHMGITLN